MQVDSAVVLVLRNVESHGALLPSLRAGCERRSLATLVDQGAMERAWISIKGMKLTKLPSAPLAAHGRRRRMPAPAQF